MSILKSLQIIGENKINNDSILVYVLKYKSKLGNICPINECISKMCVYSSQACDETHSVDEGFITKKQT